MKTLTILLVLVFAGSVGADTFGYNTAGASNQSYSGWRKIGSKGATTSSLVFTASGGETLDSLRMYVTPNGDNDSYWVAIYVVEGAKDSLNSREYIDTLIVSGGSPQWTVMPNASGSFTFSAGVTYGLASAAMNNEFQAVNFDAGGAGDDEKSDMVTRQILPDPWGAEQTGDDRKYSMVCVYTLAAGGAVPYGSNTVGGNTVGTIE